MAYYHSCRKLCVANRHTHTTKQLIRRKEEEREEKTKITREKNGENVRIRTFYLCIKWNGASAREHTKPLQIFKCGNPIHDV